MLPSFLDNIPLGKQVSVLGYDHHILALEKPVGVRSHPNVDNRVDGDALLRLPFSSKSEAYRVDDSASLYLLHRLDAPTSGVILLSDDESVARTVRQIFEDHRLTKIYYAWVKGKHTGLHKTWRDRMRVVRKGGQLRSIVGSGDPAVCHARCLQTAVVSGIPLSLLELTPETGRTHQLRVQCASRYMPIVGDATYGDFNLNRAFSKAGKEKRLFLHARKISFSLQGKPISFEASLPESFSF